MTHTQRASTARRYQQRYLALAVAAAVVVAAACSDTNVPFLTAPTVVPSTQTGLTQAITGLFASTRTDQFQVALELSAMSRELTNFTSTEPRFIEYDAGIIPIPVGQWIEVWANEYQDIRTAQQVLAALPKATPAYSAQQLAGLEGVVQTMEALNYLIVAWAHDSEGIAIMESPTAATLNPLLCIQDALDSVVTLLNAANANLNTAGATPFPIKLPPGFAAVSQFAGPSTAAGSFASFNRALAAKAYLELAYAKARAQPGTAPTPTSPGTPDHGALMSADSAANASALFLPAALPHNPSGGWSYDNFSVMYDFSASSGDQPNPMNTIIGTQAVLSQVPADQDTVNDLRWKAKFVLNPAYNVVTNPLPVQQTSYSQAHAPNSPNVASIYIVGMYPSPASPLPIIRSETLALIEAQVRLGLNDFAGALALINDVRTEVGGLSPVSLSTFPDIRNQIMKEQEISTIMEGGADRLISIRMYGMATVADTTWQNTSFQKDAHTTVFPLTAEELSGRGGNWNPTCP